MEPELSGCEGEAARSGDATAGRPSEDDLAETRRLMLTVLPDLRAFARFLVRDRTAADDLVQDTVLRALGALAQFKPGTNLKAWMFTILRNLFYEQTRRHRREAAALNARFLEDEAVRAGQDDASHLRDLHRHVWSLPPLLREALVLVGAQELSYDEAAAICGVPLGTMKARVSRARVHLTRIIAPAA